MKIRQATAIDIDAMLILLDQLFSIEQDFKPNRTKQRTGLEKLLAAEETYVIVAEVKGEVVAMATLQVLISTAEGGRCGLIEDVVVQSSFRGQGIGQVLMSHLVDWSQRQDLTRLQLLADRDNRPALAFYTKQGWSVTNLIALRK
jgi:GNAT superfamily N-acetyltransferase